MPSSPALDFYDKLAAVYDQRDHGEVPRAFFKRLKQELGRGGRERLALDLACGSGVLTELIAKHGFPVIGVDLSKPMLAIARKRCRRFGKRARILNDDLRRFKLAQPASFATLCFDVLNTIPRRTLRPILRNIRRNLEPGGFLCFDAQRRFSFEEYWDERTYHMEGEGGDLVMECDWDPELERGRVRMIGYLRERGGRYRKIESTLLEHYHEERELESALADAGFENIQWESWSPWPEQDEEPELDRTFWIAYRPQAD